jgi:hypothetical protein
MRSRISFRVATISRSLLNSWSTDVPFCKEDVLENQFGGGMVVPPHFIVDKKR